MGGVTSSLHKFTEDAKKRSLLATIPFFQEWLINKEFAKALCEKVHMKTYQPGQYIIRSGTMGSKMFVLVKGKLHLIKEGSPKPMLVKEGSHFGQLAIIVPTVRCVTFRAVTKCQILVLERKDFVALEQRFSPFIEQIKRDIRAITPQGNYNTQKRIFAFRD